MPHGEPGVIELLISTEAVVRGSSMTEAAAGGSHAPRLSTSLQLMLSSGWLNPILTLTLTLTLTPNP